MALTDLITRKYSNFRGVDFTENIVSPYRSPNALNMWKNYQDDDCIETRPGMELISSFDEEIFGLFFYKVEDTTIIIVHSGTKLYVLNNNESRILSYSILYENIAPMPSRAFIFNNIFFFMDGVNYLEFDGETMKPVEGTIPITSYFKNPDGSTSIDESTDADLVYQPVNVLTSLRKNLFIADGTSKDYQLDATDLDSASMYLMKSSINGVNYTENIDFTVDRYKGLVTFNKVPEKDVEVEITYSKTGNGYRNRILNCTLICEFDNRIFFAGNKDYPNSVFHSELNNPRYVRDTAYYTCGLDSTLIKGIVPGNNVLWIFKEVIQNASSIYYLTPTLDERYNKIYTVQNGSLSLGCVSTAINFNDDIVFFSNKGLEGVSSTQLYSEQILQHRSSMVDIKMINEPNYNDVKLAEYNGYLMCLINSHVYLADSRQKFQNTSGDIEYEWFYWELPFSINFIKEYRGVLYLGNKVGQLFKLNGISDDNLSIYSYWSTMSDDFGYPGYVKTTNKRGNVAYLKSMNNDSLKISTIVDGIEKEKSVLDDSKSYIAYRIKDKKFKKIQLKFSSNKPFGLFSCTLQGFVAGYIKR